MYVSCMFKSISKADLAVLGETSSAKRVRARQAGVASASTHKTLEHVLPGQLLINEIYAHTAVKRIALQQLPALGTKLLVLFARHAAVQPTC